MTRIVYLLGTDGAGKTTVAQRLLQSLRDSGHRTRYLYCQHRPFLLWMLKLPARLLYLRRTNQFRDYDTYKSRKDAVIGRRRGLARIYALVGYVDVWLQTWPRVFLARRQCDVLLIDRYYLDWVVNTGEFQGTGLDTMLRHARRLERILPAANLHIFLDVSEEVAFSRKNDIQSVTYLRERKSRYLQLSPHYRFQHIDANQPVDKVVADIESVMGQHLPSPAIPA